ncbi:unnamed protein product [Mytilus edulis]|uniref:Uncharacterized protein n=1 Tax=Mytilus edulis TaxID=6550 RepID=A0A8S3TFA6_MYTED|nr:unnamed protein product [Mytilus edulis]
MFCPQPCNKSIIHHCSGILDVVGILGNKSIIHQVGGMLKAEYWISQVPMFCPQPCNKSIIHHCRKRNTGCSRTGSGILVYNTSGKRNTGCSQESGILDVAQVPMFCPQPCNKSIIHHCRVGMDASGYPVFYPQPCNKSIIHHFVEEAGYWMTRVPMFYPQPCNKSIMHHCRKWNAGCGQVPMFCHNLIESGILDVVRYQCSVHNLVISLYIIVGKRNTGCSQVPMFCPQPCNKSEYWIARYQCSHPQPYNEVYSPSHCRKLECWMPSQVRGILDVARYQCSVHNLVISLKYIIVGKRNTGCSQVPMFCPQPCNKSIIHHCRKGILDVARKRNTGCSQVPMFCPQTCNKSIHIIVGKRNTDV